MPAASIRRSNFCALRNGSFGLYRSSSAQHVVAILQNGVLGYASVKRVGRYIIFAADQGGLLRSRASTRLLQSFWSFFTCKKQRNRAGSLESDCIIQATWVSRRATQG